MPSPDQAQARGCCECLKRGFKPLNLLWEVPVLEERGGGNQFRPHRV